MNRKEAMRCVPFLKTLPEAALEAIAEVGRERRLGRGELLFAENSRCLGLIVVLQGLVKVFKTDARGRVFTLGREKAGASVAELPLFDGGNYPAGAEAAEEGTSVLIVSKDAWRRLMQTYPEIAEQALRALAVRMRRLMQIVEAQTQHTVRTRLANYLLHTAQGQLSFLLEETNEAIGSQIGTVRNVVSRTLCDFKEAGLISVRRREITILDREALSCLGSPEQ
jgi:CRP-like cAMP-binding protein